MRKMLVLLLALLLIQAAAAEPAVTPSPTVLPTATTQIRAAKVIGSEIEDDGVVRVLLRSLGQPETLHLTVDGVYALEGDAGFCFARGAEPVLTAKGDEIWLETGGMIVRLGQSATFTRHASEGVGGLYIAESEKENLYCGDLSVTAVDGGLRCVVHIGMEEYLLGVVAYEMSDSFPVEALKAQAVAARTYAMGKKFSAGARDYDVSDTTADQVFKGFDPGYENVAEAVEATRGVVGTVDGGFAQCYYTASNGGVIARPGDVWGGADDGCIEMKADPFDVENPMSLVSALAFPADLSDCAALKAMVEAQLSGDDEFVRVQGATLLDEEIPGSGMFRTLQLDVTVLREITVTPQPTAQSTPEPVSDGLWSGFLFVTPQPAPETIRVEQTVPVTLSVYEDVKDGLGLGLNGGDYELLSVAATQDGFVLEMRRFGHGAGMSQRGAQQMAGEYGYSWREILGFYYPGMTLERIDWQTQPLQALELVRGYPRPEPTPKPTPLPLPAAEPGERRMKVSLGDAGSMLNVRQQPTTASRIVDQLENNREVLVSGEPDADGWVAIRTAEVSGYCKIEYLR